MNIDKKTNYYIATTRGLLRLILLLLMTVAGASGAWAVELTNTFDVSEHVSFSGGTVTVNYIPSGFSSIVFGQEGETTWTYIDDNFSPFSKYIYNSRRAAHNDSYINYDPSGDQCLPTIGNFMMLKPKYSGSLIMYVGLSASSNGGHELLLTDGSSVIDRDQSASHFQGTYIQHRTKAFSLIAGKTYYLFAGQPAGARFYGFTYTFDRTEWIFDNTDYWTVKNTDLGDYWSWQYNPHSGTSEIPGYRYLQAGISVQPLYLSSALKELPETHGLTFSEEAGKNRIAVNADNGWFMLGINSSINIPAKKNDKIVVWAKRVQYDGGSIQFTNGVNLSGESKENAAVGADAAKYEFYAGYDNPTITQLAQWAYINSIQIFSPPTVTGTISYDGVYIGEVSTLPNFTLTASDGTPLTASDFTITYSSSDTGVATVDASGRVTGVSEGSTTITATLSTANQRKCQSPVVPISVAITVKKPFEWSAASSTIDITNNDENNYQIANLPILTHINRTVRFESSDPSVASFWSTETNPRIKKPGVTTIKAINTSNESEYVTYSLTVTGTSVAGNYNSTENCFSFNSVGVPDVTKTINDVSGLIMTYGNTGSSAVIVDGPNGPLLKVIDVNGFSHPNLDAGVIPPDASYGGTYYKFSATKDGTLIIKGNLSNGTLYDISNTSSPVASGVNGSTLSVSLKKDHTYCLYNGKISGQNNASPLLHSFSFISSFVTVGLSQQWFRNNSFATEIGDIGDGTVHYTSSDPSVVAVEEGTGTGILTIKGTGTAYVTATQWGGIKGTYQVSVKNDLWDFEAEGGTTKGSNTTFGSFSDWSDLPETKGLKFQGTFRRYAGTDQWSSYDYSKNSLMFMTTNSKVMVPTIGGQILAITSRRASTKNVVSLTNVVGMTEYEERGGDYATYSFDVEENADYVIIGGVSENNDYFIRKIHTYFPDNPAASLSFPSSTKRAVIASNKQPGLTLDGSYSEKTVFYKSSDNSIAEVDPWSGALTTKAAGTVTISAYPLGIIGHYNGKTSTPQSYTLEVVPKPVETQTITVPKLCYENGYNAKPGEMDRTIPRFSLTLSGNDGAKVNDPDYIIFRKRSSDTGQLEIKPRLLDNGKKVLFTSVTLNTLASTKSGSMTVNGRTQSIPTAAASTTYNITGGTPANITLEMFKAWSSPDGSASESGTVSYKELNLGKVLYPTDVLYGNGNVNYLEYANLTGYTKMTFEGTPGVVLRILLNRVTDNGSLTEKSVTINDEGKGELDLSDISSSYIHLNGIKLHGSSPSGIITQAKVESNNNFSMTGDGAESIIISYGDNDTEKEVRLSSIVVNYTADSYYFADDLLDLTKLSLGLGFQYAERYADYGNTFSNNPTFVMPHVKTSLNYSSANTDIATINSEGVGTMLANTYGAETTITAETTFTADDYFSNSSATYKARRTLTINKGESQILTGVSKGQEVEVEALSTSEDCSVIVSNTIGSLINNSFPPSMGNILTHSGSTDTPLTYGNTASAYYVYATDGSVTITNNSDYPLSIVNFHSYWRETENTINYKKYTDYKKYDDFTDEAGPFVYAGGFSLPAPTLKIVDVKTGEDVTSLYQLSPGSYVSNHSAAVVNSGTGELASTYTKASVTAITDVTISAAMQTDAWGFNPSAALTGPVRVYPYDMTWYFPDNSSTEGLQFTGNHAVSMVDSENRLNIIGNVISSVMIPVQKKQKVVVTAHAFRNDNGAGGNQTINLRNAADIYEEIASQTTYNWATVDYEYTAQEDGYLTLKNITREHYASGRTLSIQKIVVKPQEILFADGPEVSIGTTVGTGSYQNPIINPMDDEVTYSYSVDVSRLAIDASFDNSKGIFTANSSGELFKTTPLGDLVVSVTASKADLVHEQTGHYTLKVITYNFQKQELSNNYDGNPWAVTQLENPLESSASPVPGPDVIYYEYIEGNPKVDIDHTAGSTTYTVTVNGLGKVRIVAVSGVISTSFVMNSNYDPSSGKTDFVNTMPSVPYGTKTYSQFVQGWTHLVGENVVSDDDVTWTILEKTKGVSDWTFTSPGVLYGSGTGWGVIKVQATKGGDSHTYCLTVQRPLSQSDTYTKQSTGENWSYNYYTWDFHSYRLHKYVADVDNNMTANSYISDDLANTVETTDWKWFQRKEDGTGNKTQYVHFYKPALLGDNGFVIPETIGLQIESAAFTRTTTGGGRKGFGIINVYESRTGEGGLSATPAAAMTASGDRRGLSLQEGVTLTIPKLKAGWYVEMQWARLDPISGNRLQTTNLLDLNGNLVNTKLLIGRCQDNLDHGGYYTFQVAGDPLDNDDYRDVSFTVMPKGYDDLYQIRVYDGDYQETMSEMKVGQNETNIADTDINDPSSPMQYYRILYDEDSDDVPPVNFTYANNLGSAVAPSRVSVSTEGPLEVELAYGVSHAPIAYGSSEREHGYYPYPMVKLLNDYGRFYITYTMFSEDRKYVVSRKTYRLKVGLVPHQQYPYTWNFTNISGGETLRKMNNAYNSIKPDGATWYAYGYNMFELNTTATDGSYYVPGATLVSSVRNLGSDGTREELMAAGEGCDEFNGLGFEGKIAFKTAAQDGDEEAATELTSGIQSSLLHYSMDDTSYDPAASVVLAAGYGHVKFGAPTKRTDASSHGVDGYSSGYSYLMDGGNTKNVLLIPQRAFRNGDVITIKGYYLVGDGSKGGFSFYETNTSTTPLATEYLTDVTANKLHTVVHTVTAGDGIAGLSEVYLFRADKTQPGMYLTEVEVTAGGGTKPVGYGRKLKCIGGPVTITIPDLNADGKLDWIYIKSSAAPTSIVKGETNATLVEDAATGGADAEEGVFKYKVPEEGSYLVTFAENTEIERIGVTHILKPITAVGTMGWATESRDIAIDHDLTGVLTKNDVNAYSVSVKSSDLQRVTVKLDAVNNNAASNDEQHNANRAVPAKAGIVLKLDATTNLSLANSGGVPLFVPAMSTSIVSYDNMKYSLSGNHMMANLTERTLLYEQETGEIDDDGDSFDDTGRASGDYTRFILAQRFISWKKTTLTEDDGAPTETTSHSSEFETLPTPAAVFYRLHKFEDSERSDYSDTEITSKTADLLNTLGDNKAYLLLPTGTLPKALWDTSGAGGAREFVAIQGVSDMEEELGEDGGLLRHRVDNRTYDLRGRVVDDGNLKPGVYIRGGKKFIVR